MSINVNVSISVMAILNGWERMSTNDIEYVNVIINVNIDVHLFPLVLLVLLETTVLKSMVLYSL